MPTQQEEFFVDVTDLTGGRNDSLPPHDIAINECVDAVNITWDQTRFAQKRVGMSTAPLSGIPFTGPILSLFRHVPANDESKSEFWAFGPVGGAYTFARVTTGRVWETIAPADPVSAYADVSWCTFQGKLFIGYSNSANRLHCWDGSVLRRVGLTLVDVPPMLSAVDQGTGSYGRIQRHYKVSYVQMSGADTVRRSPLSSSIAFLPSGTGASVAVYPDLTKRPNEGETHYEVWGSADGAEYFQLSPAPIPLATSFFSDVIPPDAYASNGALAPDVGDHLPPEAWKFIAVHQNRLVGAGTWATTNAKHNRVWFTPQSGTTDIGDEERVQNTTTHKGWIDVNEKDGDAITGLAGFMGVVWVFKRRHIYKLVPTMDDRAPYNVVEVNTGGVGCIAFRTIDAGEDEHGTPSLYFCGERGLYRLSLDGVQFCGRNMAGLWAQLSLRPEVYGSVFPNQQLFGVWYEATQQYWLFAAVRGEAIGVRTINIFHARWGRVTEEGVNGGWTRYLYQNQDATGTNLITAACMYARTIGHAPTSVTTSQELRPYLATQVATFAPQVILGVDPASRDDAGVPFAGHVRLAEKAFAGLGRRFAVRKLFVVGLTAESLALPTVPVLRVRLSIDFGHLTRTVTWAIGRQDPASAQQRRIWYVEEAEANDCGTVEILLGDQAAAATGAWTLEGARVLMQAQQVP